MYTAKRYGDSSLWNLKPDDNPINPTDIKIQSISTTSANGLIEAENTYLFNAIGSFMFDGTPSTFQDLSGYMNEARVLKNGSLIVYESWSDGYNFTDVKTYSFERELSYLTGNDWFEGSATFNNDDGAQGLDGNDTFIGYGDEQYHDIFFGGRGIDKSIYRGNLSEYSITEVDYIWDDRVSGGARVSGWEVTDLIDGRDGTDWLNTIERFIFSDVAIAVDTAKWDNAGSAYRLYTAAFDRAPDESGLGYWIDVLDDGGSLQLAASGFINSAEFQSLYGANPSDTLFVTKLYNNVLDRDPDQSGLNYWIGQLNGGMSRESALINFSESNENLSNVTALIENGIQYQLWLG